MSYRVPLFLCILVGTLALSACSDTRTFDVRGRVVGFGDDGRTVIVEHEDVPGLMPAMTMPFTVRDTAGISQLNVRDAIGFRLSISSDSSWISDIKLLADTAVAEHPAGTRSAVRGDATPRVLEIGDEAPQFELLTHADTTLTLAELEGQAVLLTFIYTKCPLPEYCPLMSRSFARVQDTLQERSRSVHLLSVSLDPQNDTPAVLRDYASRYTNDLSSWIFATGDSVQVKHFAESFGEYYAQTRSEIVHNLVTVLIGPDGRIRKYWRGNDWSPKDVVAAVDELTPAS